jgi:hypothetical protein
MVPLQEVPADESTGPMTFEPPIAGKYRWMGTSTLVFLPDKPLPYSTQYTVKIPSGIKSVSGAVLQKEYVWSFETPRPKVTMRLPQDQAIWIKLDQKIFLQYNQPVDSTNVASYTRMFEYDRKTNQNNPIAYTIHSPTSEEFRKAISIQR